VTASKNSKPSRTIDRLSDLFECRLKPAFDFPIDLFFRPALAHAVENSLKAMTKPRARVRVLLSKFGLNLDAT
jgi:hypothetical protein